MSRLLTKGLLTGGLFLQLVGSLQAQPPAAISITRTGDSIWLTIPEPLLDRQWLVVNRLLTANAGSSQFADDQLGTEKVISFHKKGTAIDIQVHDYTVYSPQAGSPMARAVERNNQPPALASLPLAAARQGNCIEVSAFLKTSKLFYNDAVSVGRIDSREELVGITAQRLPQGTDKTPADVYSTLFLLPKTPMHARIIDERVGYFRTSYRNLSSPDHAGSLQELVCRWRLEPAPGDLAKYRKGILVEPVRPIVFYIDPATPKAWVPWLLQGINDWQAAFEQAGFKNAIIGKEAPANDPDWQLASCRAAIIYKPSLTENAFGPNVHDPRSGEIIQAHVNWHHNILGWLQAMYLVQTAATEPAARSAAFDDALLGRLIRSIACHEVGHALGLTHNFGSSATVPVDSLRSNQWLQQHGQCPSIMDYARFNYVAQPGDDVLPENMLPRIGDYDKWAIEWGYRSWPAFASEEAEKAFLNQWVRSKTTDPKLVWGNGESIPGGSDPATQREDLGNDPLLAGAYGIANLQRIVPQLREWLSNAAGDDTQLRRVYREILGATPNGAPLGQYSYYISNAATLIGGVYHKPLVTEDTIPVKTYPTPRQQRMALDFLDRHLFQTPHWLLEPGLLQQTGSAPLILLGTLQHATLVQLFSRIGNLQTAEALYGPQVFSTAELLDSLRTLIWCELDSRQPIDIYRRSLQNIFINSLGRVMNTPDGTDTYAMAQGILKKIRTDAAAYSAQCTDTATSDHLLAVQRRIDKVLHNK
ncbi:MAG: zinc-dependent metalloprotease [Candidatus Pseudobacter hemicellulosilyticus]|uniref:Zinc-dependent metalloprotease n=1 Tax=Candidatus Pseudobacter hemicellulosilyticus TaxID=3121375 RepID=A0AAJ5WQM4_9BACT|nr:MAG: zinc-dependent metalloprotease [Pseudobacter sp.]